MLDKLLQTLVPLAADLCDVVVHGGEKELVLPEVGGLRLVRREYTVTFMFTY